MKRGSWGEITLLFLGNLLVRLPFFNAGYGREEDAWAQALNARIISDTGVYEVSRLPGHPLYELFLAGLWPIEHSTWLFNLISALATAMSVVYFYRICQKLKLQNVFFLSIAFSFIPAFFIAGTYTIDYNIGLLFVLISFYHLLYERFWVAGLFIGIATGIRISHLGFVLPWAILTFTRTHSVKNVLKMGVSSAVIGFIAFLPPLLTYGMEFLDFHKPPYPGVVKVLYKMTIGLYGIPLLLFFVGFFIANIRKPLSFWTLHSYYSRLPKGFFISVMIIFAMQLFIFLRLPYKSEFFIPFLPFLMIYLGTIMERKYVIRMALASVISCFLLGFDYYNPYRGAPPSSASLQFNVSGKSIHFDPIQGPAIIDLRKRDVKTQLVENFETWACNQADKTYLVAGWYWPEIEVREMCSEIVETDYYGTEEEVMEAYKAGKAIYYLPEINEANAQINGHNLLDSLGTLWTPALNKQQ